MKKRSVAIHVVGMALVAGTLIALNVVTLQYKGLITTHFNQTSYKIETSELDKDLDTEYYKKDFETEAELEEYNGNVCKEIESEGLVLLKNNNNTLPLAKNSKVSLFSVSSVDLVLGGTGSGSVDTDKALNFKEALEDEGFEVNSTLWDFYTSKHNDGYTRSSPNWRGGNFAIKEVPWADVNNACASSFNEYSDAAIVVLSRSGGEGSDLTAHDFAETMGVNGNSGSYLELSKEETDMLDALNQKFGKIVVLINANNTMELGALDKYDNVKAVMWVGGLGQTGVSAVAEALNGTINPSGRLVDTYAYDVSTAPAAVNAGSNFWIDNKPTNAGYVNEADQYILYQEGIYVGYRYYETRYEDAVMGAANVGNYDYSTEVLYPFGYGLSYTTFEQSNFKFEQDGDTFKLTCTVTNTGDVAGKDVVQAYFQSPYTDYDKTNLVEKSSVELGAFYKTGLLEPGASEEVTLTIDKSDLTSYDYTKAKTYILDAGEYYFTIADNVHEAVNNILAKKGYETSDGMTSAGNENFVGTYLNTTLDTTTYSKDSKTNKEITNLFDDCSITYYDEYKDVKYLTRNDWSGTFPKAFADSVDDKGEYHITFPDELIADLAPKYDEDEGDYTMPKLDQFSEITLAKMIGASYDDTKWTELLDSMSWDTLQTIVRMGGYGTPVIGQINKPATVEKDGPAGISATLIGGSKGMAYPTEVVIASTWNKDLAEKYGVAVGNDAFFANVQGWYAPAMNTHRNAYAGRNFEYYSEDPLISGEMGAATVKGAASKGLFAYVKHFALNDTEGVIDELRGIKGSKDGIATFFNEQAAREIYLKPFEKTVKEGKNTAMMNAFNRVGTTWCGASKNLLTGLLREEWGFEGTIITDMAGLESYMDIKAGLQAGTNMWMNTKETMFSLDAYKNDPQIVTYMRNSAHNVLYTVANSAAMNGLGPNSTVVAVLPEWICWMIALDVVVGVGIIAWAGLIIYFQLRKKNVEDKEINN